MLNKKKIVKQSREISIAGIMDRIPHRYPFLMIDRVVDWDDKKAMAIKNVTINEPYFTGHFPAEPIMPGMMIGEAMAQTSAFIGQPVDDGSDASFFVQRAFLTRINLKIIRPVVPGDQLILTAQLVKHLGSQMSVRATAHVDRAEVALADLSVAMVSL